MKTTKGKLSELTKMLNNLGDDLEISLGLECGTERYDDPLFPNGITRPTREIRIIIEIREKDREVSSLPPKGSA